MAVVPTLIPASAMNFTENQQACIVLEKLWSQREAGRFCDVVLHVQGQKFQAHRNVLAACSPYFDSVLKTHKTVKEQLTVTCQNLDAFQLLLNYMYTGAVVIDKNNVAELLRLANHFLVIKLKNYCAEYLDRYLDPSNCLTVREMAEKYNLPGLQKNASMFIHNHIVEVFEQSEILEFTLNKLESFFKEKQCLIPQLSLLNFICRWVDHDVSKRENDLRTLLTFVNWDSIERTYLEDHIKNSSLCRNNPKCMYLLLSCLEENKVEFPEYQTVYASLKNQFGPGGTNVDNDSFMNIAISAAIQGLQKFPITNSNAEENNAPITVAPLEKEQAKEKLVTMPPVEVPSKVSSDNESTNSSYADLVPDDGGGGCDIDYDDDSPTSTEEKPSTPVPVRTNRRKVPPRKLKPKSPPRKVTMTTRRSTQIQKTVPPIKITRKSTGSITTKPAMKHVIKAIKASPKPILKTPPKPVVLKKSVGRPGKKRYVSETDSDDDDDEEEEVGGTSSATDSDVEESVNGHGNKSKWKDGVKCPNCSYIAHSSVRLEQHVSRIHAKDVTYKCKVCDFTCKWNREYYLHMKTHFQGPPFRCETCEYTCDRIQFLLSHRMRHTDERPFKCDECDHRCRTKANLDCHMRCHTGEKPYQCEHCERRFAIKASLDQHLASHREDRPFLCDTCGFSTKYQSHLFSHKRIHTGDVFRCHFPNCKYSTPKKSQLGSHHRTHTAVRSHICSICGRAFIEKSHLVRHERIHLNEKPFKCEHCDYCSSRRDKLKEHFRKHHGENATAKGPYRPRKQRRQGYDPNVYSPPNKNNPESENNQLQPQQHIELQTAVSAIGNNPPPAPVVYSYESSHQVTLHSHAAVALQQLGAAAHNYQVAFMEQRHHQPHHHHHHHHQHAHEHEHGHEHQHAHQHAHAHPHVGPTPPSAVPAMMTDQNRVNVVAVSSHDGTNVVGQPSEFSPFMSFI